MVNNKNNPQKYILRKSQNVFCRFLPLFFYRSLATPNLVKTCSRNCYDRSKHAFNYSWVYKFLLFVYLHQGCCVHRRWCMIPNLQQTPVYNLLCNPSKQWVSRFVYNEPNVILMKVWPIDPLLRSFSRVQMFLHFIIIVPTFLIIDLYSFRLNPIPRIKGRY